MKIVIYNNSLSSPSSSPLFYHLLISESGPDFVHIDSLNLGSVKKKNKKTELMKIKNNY